MTLTPRTYVSEEQGFTTLPASDQVAFKAVDQAEAEVLNTVVNTRVDGIMKDMGIKTSEEAQESTTGVIDRGDYLEVARWKVSRENLGEPTLPKGEIEINAEVADRKKPHAWSYLIDENTISNNGKYIGFELWKRIFPWFENMSENDAKKEGLFPATLWLYNYEGAKKEIEHRGQYYPSLEELSEMTNSVSGNCIEKAKALKIPFVGCRNSDTSKIDCDENGKFDCEGLVAYLWSSSPTSSVVGARFLYLHRNYDDSLDNGGNRGNAFLVRPFLDNTRV